jgi:DNA-binding transcriptional regulator YiaG
LGKIIVTIPGMPNIASVLKSEIARIARKEVRAQTAVLKKAAVAHRSEIAALKRRVQATEQQLRHQGKSSAPAAPAAENEVSSARLRFSAKGLAAQRKRLGLSARECGLLFGTSAQSVYNWEEGKIRPHAKHLAAIVALRSLGKKQARAHLESLGQAG